MTSSGRSHALRRYPALSYLAGAAALALLLPSGLTLPQSGPTTLAELAPVPGQGQGQGDVAELGQAGSGGLGSGGGAAAGTTTTVAGGGADDEGDGPGGGRLVRKPGTKNCVGSPARQTEDPLSPPCIAYFDGDNGGATAKGVTRETVTVLVYMTSSSSDERQGEVVDCGESPTAEDTLQDVLCKSFHRYFNHRYQTYGRVVRLWAVHNGNAVGELDARYQPFAAVTVNAPDSPWARAKSLAVGYSGLGRPAYTQYAPYLVGFRPDLEDLARLAASYACVKLKDRPARHAGDATLQQQTRVFGLWGDNSPSAYERALLAGLDAECGIKPVATARGSGNPTAATQLANSGVTTVLSVMQPDSVALITQHATQARWFPEWFVPGSPNTLATDINFYGRTANQLQWANAFGISVDYRRGAIPEQPWYRAYREGCPRDAECPEPQVNEQATLFAAAAYDALTMLFYGIQAAGPRLTVDNVDRGMHAIVPRASDDPFRPAAYFAPGNYTFVKDAMGIYWDPTGTPPGSPAGGCWRLAGQGRRFRAGEWRAGDQDVKEAGPCQADTFR